MISINKIVKVQYAKVEHLFKIASLDSTVIKTVEDIWFNV